MKRYNPLTELFLYRMRTFYREPEAMFWTYGFPILLTLALGLAFRSKPPEVVAVDIVASANAADIKAKLLELDDILDIEINTQEDCTHRLRYGKTSIVIKTNDSGDSVEYQYDPTRPESALARAKIDDALQRAVGGRQDPIPVTDNEVTEPGARYIDFLVPGLLGMNLMGGGLWGCGFVLTDMRVKKLLKRLIATPMRKSHFLLSLIGGRLVFTIPELLALLGSGWLVFNVRIEGGIINIVLMALIGALSFTGIGLLVASRAEKIETISGLMNLVMLPMWLCSGVFFSYERFPESTLPFIKLLPLTQLNDALRSIILEGSTIFDQGVPILILAIWGVISFILAIKWFRWT